MKLKLNLSILAVFAFVLAACGGTAATETMTEDVDSMEHMDEGEEMDHEDGKMGDMEMEEGDHDHDAEAEVVRVPNDGAVISIQSPSDGSSFALDEGIQVEIAVANFTLGEDNNHWHVYVDGVSWGMITGEDTSHVLQGIEAGEHLVEVYLAVGTHEELENGDAIIITVAGN